MQDLMNQIFGRLTVIAYVGKDTQNRNLWLCKCLCGKEKTVRHWNLTSGMTKSCGCLQKDIVAKQGVLNTKHGMVGTRFYMIWVNMKKRCLNNKCVAYKNYGERGIKISKEWSEFKSFYDSMYESYQEHINTHGEKNTTLDRIDNNKNYYKENCKWSTRKEQEANKRAYCHQKSFKAVSPEGIEYTANNQSSFARIYKLHKGHINECLKGTAKNHKGWKFSYV